MFLGDCVTISDYHWSVLHELRNRKLKEMGMTNDFISESTGLSKEEIERL